MDGHRILVPVIWRDEKGNPVRKRTTTARPFITIEVSARGQETWQRTEALVQTGSSETLIAPDLLKAAGCISVAADESSGDLSVSATYQIDLRFPHTPVSVIQTEGKQAEESPGASQGLSLIGIDVLRCGRLFLAPPGNTSFFELDSRNH